MTVLVILGIVGIVSLPFVSQRLMEKYVHNKLKKDPSFDNDTWKQTKEMARWRS